MIFDYFRSQEIVFWCPFKVKNLFLLQSRNQNLKNWEFPMLPKRLYVRRGFSFLSTSSFFLLYQQSNSFTYLLITKFRNSQNAIAKYPFIVLFYAGEYGKIIEWQHQTKKYFVNDESWIEVWLLSVITVGCKNDANKMNEKHNSNHMYSMVVYLTVPIWWWIFWISSFCLRN